MADEAAVECPQCGHDNEAAAETCAKCGVSLEWALERGSRYWTEAAATRPPLILLSDDDPGLTLLIGMTLERAGYRVARAESACATLELAERLRPDLIITDFMKPGMNGAKMISRLKSNPVSRDIPVVMLSAGGDYWRMSTAMEAGATCYLLKPIFPRTLAAVVASVLAGELLPLVLFVHVETTRELEESLGEKGYRILAPYPREETIRGAKLLKPDVIAIAFHLPEADGLDMLAHLKAEPGLRDIPVVMLADEPEPQLKQRALELGAHAVHTGPLDAESLAEVLRAALDEG